MRSIVLVFRPAEIDNSFLDFALIVCRAATAPGTHDQENDDSAAQTHDDREHDERGRKRGRHVSVSRNFDIRTLGDRERKIARQETIARKLIAERRFLEVERDILRLVLSRPM